MNDYMLVYGGIFFVTKELNDLHVFDMRKEKWVCLFEELNSPAKSTMQAPGSALRKAQAKAGFGTTDSPRKAGDHSKTAASLKPGATRKSLNTSQSKRKPKPKLGGVGSIQADERVIELESPTSVTMRNSFLIKNADPSFEKSYALIRKRALERERTGMPANDYDEALTKTCGKRPPARDGHTGAIVGECMFVFGGDRHCMPFNDFHMLDIKSEFSLKSYLF